MTKYTLECPMCKQIVEYKAKRGMLYAKKQKTPCPSCRGKTPRRHEVGITEWYRECPSCKNIKYYSSKRNYTRAVETNSSCPHCHPGPSKETVEKIVQTLKTKRYPNRASNTQKGKDLPFKRNCPKCNNELGYASEFSFNRAIKQNTVCNSCACIIYKKSWTYVIKEEHVKKMAAKKAGYTTHEAYLADLDNRKKYYREVRKITRQQDISLLENYDKLRGLCGVEGAYQLDHIIPVSAGYEQGLPAEKIGHISNLQIIPWKDNLLKSNK
jgi:hypothetical protein